MRAPVVPATLLLVCVGCDAATPPERPAPYDYAIRLATGPVLTFRWPETSLPVRIWVEPGTDLRHVVETAIRAWEGVALYHEFTGVVVEDSIGADVRVRLTTPFASDQSTALDCGGSTTIGVERDTTITLPFLISLSSRSGVNNGDVADCLLIVATHELGHALGLFLHSDDPGDLMYARPSLDGLSPRDRATFSTLYHSPVSVRLPIGR
jgi:predicted Zn-dependent protease